MGDKAGLRSPEYAEAAFDELPAVVVVIVLLHIGIAPPVDATFDAKVVVGAPRQLAAAGIGLEYGLCQLDTGRNARPVHLPHGNVFVAGNVVNVILRNLCLRTVKAQGQQQGEKQTNVHT